MIIEAFIKPFDFEISIYEMAFILYFIIQNNWNNVLERNPVCSNYLSNFLSSFWSAFYLLCVTLLNAQKIRKDKLGLESITELYKPTSLPRSNVTKCPLLPFLYHTIIFNLAGCCNLRLQQ